MRDPFGGREPGFLGGGGSRKVLAYMRRGRERCQRWMGSRRSTGRKRCRWRRRAGAEGREFYGS